MSWLETVIQTHGIFVGLLASLASGLALNLTPCVYPMIPVTLAFFSSQAEGRARRSVGLAFSYVLGMSMSYAVLGLIASQTGALLGSWLQQPAVLIGIAGVILALSLSLFGVYEFRVPSFITNRLGQASTGFGGAFAMGLVVGLAAAPCVGPFVLGLLLLASRLNNPPLAFAFFFMLGFGMGLPYLVLAPAAQRLSRLPRAGAWLVWSKKFLGFVLFGLVLYFLRPILPDKLEMLGVVLLCAAAGVYLGFLEGSHSGKTFRVVRMLTGVGLLASAAVIAWPHPVAGPQVAWAPYTKAALAEARAAGKPAVIDLYADWCLPCVELDHTTFHNPSVVAALNQTVALRVDATQGISKEAEALTERYQVVGVPTVLFFDRAGNERPDLRLVGFEAPEAFLNRLRKLNGS